MSKNRYWRTTTTSPELKECNEWRTKYDPHKLKLGMVHPDSLPNFEDTEHFNFLHKRVELFETHINERLPEDLRKYILYIGGVFFNWSAWSISLGGWNEDDETDERPFCTWCKNPLTDKCKTTSWFNGDDLENDDQPGLVRFSHEGCGFFKFIVVAGPLKGTIYSGNPNSSGGPGDYLSKDKSTFLELLDNIYLKK